MEPRAMWLHRWCSGPVHYKILTIDWNNWSLLYEKNSSFAPNFLRVLFLINRNAYKLCDIYGDVWFFVLNLLTSLIYNCSFQTISALHFFSYSIWYLSLAMEWIHFSRTGFRIFSKILSMLIGEIN